MGELSEAIEHLTEINHGKLSRFSVLMPGIAGSVLYPSSPSSVSSISSHEHNAWTLGSSYGPNGIPSSEYHAPLPNYMNFPGSSPPHPSSSHPPHSSLESSPFSPPGDFSASAAVPGAPLNMAPSHAQQMQQPYPASPESAARSSPAEYSLPQKPAESKTT